MPAPSRLSMDLRDGRKSAINRLRSALRKHDSLADAARALGVAPRTFWQWSQPGRRDSIAAVVAAVAELRKEGPTREQRVDMMRELRKQGLSLREIGAQVGVSEATVSRELRSD